MTTYISMNPEFYFALTNYLTDREETRLTLRTEKLTKPETFRPWLLLRIGRASNKIITFSVKSIRDNKKLNHVISLRRNKKFLNTYKTMFTHFQKVIVVYVSYNICLPYTLAFDRMFKSHTFTFVLHHKT